MKYITGAVRSDKVTEREKENRRLAYEAAAEGIVLLKNDNQVLPLKEKKIALYGAGAVMTIKGGTGSGEVNERYSVSILEGLKNAGFEITTEKWLEDYQREYDQEWERYKKKRKSTSIFKMADVINIMSNPMMFPYGRLITEADAAKGDCRTAIYVVARQAGEGSDKKIQRGEFDLSQTEIQNLRFLSQHYTNTVLIINSGSQMNLKVLDEVNISAVLYFCQQGMEGGNALADILAGKISPSGKLVDTWVKDYYDIPFANEYSYLSGDTSQEYYKEGIFVGYRYFDTFHVEPRFHFGEGMSYTSFCTSVQKVDYQKKKVTAAVRGENTGSCAGKEVVQLYVRLPEGELEKENKRLASFAKTRLLSPGECEILTLQFDLFNLTSYDEDKAAYVIEAGEYVLEIGTAIHRTKPTAVLHLKNTAVLRRTKNLCKSKIKISELKRPAVSHTSKAEVPYIEIDADTIETEEIRYGKPAQYHDSETDRIMNGLKIKDMAEICVGAGINGMFNGKGIACPGAIGRTTDKFYKKGLPNVNLSDGPAGLRLLKISSITPKGKVKMKDYIMSIIEFMPSFMLRGITVNEKKDQLLYQFTTAFPVGTALAQSWNTELLEKIGYGVSREMEEYYVTYWLAPALNIHRNPLCGRNFEYFSEDPLLSGKMAAALTRGVQKIPGNYVTIKHFAANNQEDNRNHSNSNVDERALREIYLSGFEIAVKEGRPKSVMSSYNKLNGIYTANSYELLTGILRNEWGFDGVVMSDWYSTGKDQAQDETAIAAGNDLIMPGMGADKKNIVKAVKKGTLSESDLRTATANIIRQILGSKVAKSVDITNFK